MMQDESRRTWRNAFKRERATLLFLIVAMVPHIAGAQTIFGLLTGARRLLAAVVPVVFALAVFYFFWGLARYILNAGNETKQGEGKTIMTWGIVVLFIMSSIWGIIWILQGDILGGPVPVVLPQLRR